MWGARCSPAGAPSVSSARISLGGVTHTGCWLEETLSCTHCTRVPPSVEAPCCVSSGLWSCGAINVSRFCSGACEGRVAARLHTTATVAMSFMLLLLSVASFPKRCWRKVYLQKRLSCLWPCTALFPALNSVTRLVLCFNYVFSFFS